MTAFARALGGALDIAGAGELHALALEVARDATADVVFDCSAVERIDAAGAQVLIALGRTLAGRGCKLVLVGMSDRVCALLATAGLAPALGIARAAGAAGRTLHANEGHEGDAGENDEQEKEQVRRA